MHKYKYTNQNLNIWILIFKSQFIIHNSKPVNLHFLSLKTLNFYSALRIQI